MNENLTLNIANYENGHLIIWNYYLVSGFSQDCCESYNSQTADIFQVTLLIYDNGNFH
jgi:hypothetical protein